MGFDKWNKLKDMLISDLNNNRQPGYEVPKEYIDGLFCALNYMTELDSNEFQFKLNQSGINTLGEPLIDKTGETK